MVDGSTVEYIGRNKVDETFFADYDASYPQNVVGASDPKSALVLWIYPGAGNASGVPNKYIAYNWYTKRWTHGDLDAHWIYNSIGAGYTVEDLDNVNASLDALTPSLDSPIWKGGVLNLAAYGTDHKKSVFGGTALSGVMETAEIELTEGHRSLVSSVRPLVDGATTQTIQVGTRNLQDASTTFSTAETPNTETGRIHPRSDSRYHKFRVNTTGDFTHAMGVEVDAQRSGWR